VVRGGSCVERGSFCGEGLEIRSVQAPCEIICIFNEGIAKPDFPLIPTPSTQSLKICFLAAHAHIYSKPYTRPQRLRAICSTFLSLAFSKREKNEPRFSEGFVRKGGYSNGEPSSVLLHMGQWHWRSIDSSASQPVESEMK
jgi:hypothetical protein